ncbi:uncharacterized protein METZ01_LOCUS461011, partial [marine metagenome]
MNYKISHPTKIIECEIDLPTSKSISNRVLIIQALCKKTFEIQNLSNSDDTISLKKAIDSNSSMIDVGLAGTAFRFLTSYLAILKNKECILTGSQRIKERPIKGLIDALNYIGSDISFLDKEGFLPIKIKGRELMSKKIKITGAESSQFISSLLLIAPTLKNGLVIEIFGKIVSESYIKMTLKLMEYFGISTKWDKNTITINHQEYIGKNIEIEKDWSAASFWFE